MQLEEQSIHRPSIVEKDCTYAFNAKPDTASTVDILAVQLSRSPQVLIDDQFLALSRYIRLGVKDLLVASQALRHLGQLRMQLKFDIA